MKNIVALVVLIIPVGWLPAQTNTFPSSGNVGIGTTSPNTRLQINSDGTNSPYMALDKNPDQETGIEFRKSGGILFYLFNDGDDALKIRANGVGETDMTPRIWLPFTNKDLYLSTAGGNVAIGHTNPAYRLDVMGPANDWKARFQGPDGYITIGPLNSSWAHIYTDRPNFIFNQSVWSIPGGFSSYDQADLSLMTNGTTRLTISKATGNVGIGTSTPTGQLEIKGPYAGNSQLIINTTSSNAEVRFSNNNVTKGFVWYEPVHDLMAFGRGNYSNSIFVNATGNVGIGTGFPNERLTVNGTIYGKEVKVDLSVPGPDYVFEKSYDLPTLEEIKTYIEQHKHLPDVPSAEEMKADGIKLAEMNMTLLKKVEELTLYIMQQQQEIDKLKKAVYETK
jgi:hypothetical protein